MKMNRYWVSWYSNYCQQCGHTKPPFQVWISGQCADDNLNCEHDIDRASICAVIDAPNEESIWKVVAKHFPDYEERFIQLEKPDFIPGNRFPGFENKTRLE